ncbi:MAG: thioester dehydrase [Neisseria sp.]|nr:thioester dehydrase [Neisseria sp.]
MQCPITHVAPLLPHSGAMVLFETVESYDTESLRGTAMITPDSPLADNGHFAAWATMEVMAQGIGALAGALAHDAGEPVRLGFLLGTRCLELFFDTIPAPCRLGVSVRQSILDHNGFGVFDCELTLRHDPHGKASADDRLLARAALNAFQPKNVEDYLKESA